MSEEVILEHLKHSEEKVNAIIVFFFIFLGFFKYVRICFQPLINGEEEKVEYDKTIWTPKRVELFSGIHTNLDEPQTETEINIATENQQNKDTSKKPLYNTTNEYSSSVSFINFVLVLKFNFHIFMQQNTHKQIDHRYSDFKLKPLTNDESSHFTKWSRIGQGEFDTSKYIACFFGTYCLFFLVLFSVFIA